MKNAEGIALPFELERRLKQSTDRLRDVRETLEELGRSADALHRLFGVEQVSSRLKAAPPPARPAQKAAEARTQRASAPTAPQTPTGPASARAAQPPPSSSAPSATTNSGEEEIPEWRKVFPELSAEVPPGRRR